MKRLLMMALAICSMTVAFAQKDNSSNLQGGRVFSVEQYTQNMVSKLGLDDSQAAKVKALNEKYASILQGPGRGPRPPRDNMQGESGQMKQQPPQLTDEQKQEMESKMKEMRTQRESYNKELKSILSDSQYKSYEKMQPQRPRGPQQEAKD
ncbi:MAG: DUF4890 domain-containing protein [Prevotella sp.]|jgi:hypothetical protein